MNKLTVFAVVIAAHLGAVSLAADYHESVDGDLSGTPETPTPWLLSNGPNDLSGDAGTTGGMLDVDLVAFTVPDGHQLDSITINYLNDETDAFLGLQ